MRLNLFGMYEVSLWNLEVTSWPNYRPLFWFCPASVSLNVPPKIWRMVKGETKPKWKCFTINSSASVCFTLLTQEVETKKKQKSVSWHLNERPDNTSLMDKLKDVFLLSLILDICVREMLLSRLHKSSAQIDTSDSTAAAAGDHKCVMQANVSIMCLIESSNLLGVVAAINSSNVTFWDAYKN